MFERTISLIGENNLNKIKNTKVLLIGIGGVGGMSLETLVRNGFDNITVVDCDTIEHSNLNRQIITTNNNISHSKVIEAILRAKSINASINIDGIEKRLDSSNIKQLLDLNYDYIIDACDSIDVKYALIENSMHYDYKLITCLGTAKKLNPTRLCITTLDKTYNDPIARILRSKVKKNRINKKLYVVFSDEVPSDINVLGSMSCVPNTAGILTVYYILNDILKK